MREDQPSKKSFFAALEQLDDLDNQSEEDDPLERLIAPSRSLNIQNRTAASASTHPEPASLLRAHSDPQSSFTDTRRSEPIVVEDSQPRRSETISDTKPRMVKRSETIGTMPGTKTGGPPPSKKRKTNSIKMHPEEQQIFKGFIFCERPGNPSARSRLRLTLTFSFLSQQRFLPTQTATNPASSRIWGSVDQRMDQRYYPCDCREGVGLARRSEAPQTRVPACESIFMGILSSHEQI